MFVLPAEIQKNVEKQSTSVKIVFHAGWFVKLAAYITISRDLWIALRYDLHFSAIYAILIILNRNGTANSLRILHFANLDYVYSLGIPMAAFALSLSLVQRISP